MILRLIGLGTQSFWLDEVTTLHVAKSPLSAIIQGQVIDNHTPPLYYALIHFWLKVFPSTEVGLRLFSAFVDGLNMVLLLYLFRRFVGEKNLLLVLAAYALSPFMLYYSQEGRMYTLVVFIALSCSFALVQVVVAPAHRFLWAVISGILLAMGVYTHYYFAFFALGIYSLALYSSRHSRRSIILIVMSGLLGVLLFAPWIPVALNLATSDGQIFRRFTWQVIPYTIFRFVVGYAIFPVNMHSKERFIHEILENWFPIAAVFGSLVFLAYCFISSIHDRRKHLLLGTAWIVSFPGIVGLLVSLKTPMLSERYMIVVLPFFYLMVLGTCLLSCRHEIAAVVLFLILLLAGDLAYFFNPNFGKAEWRAAAHYVQSVTSKDDIVLIEPEFTSAVFNYYFKAIQPVRPMRFKPLLEDSAGTEKQIHELLTFHPRVTLVSSGSKPDDGYAKVLEKLGRRKSTQTFPLETGITCTTWELPAEFKILNEVSRKKEM